jgi:MoaA/NifB/PqqE/SkfB family radical SAM enzyme
MKLIKKVKREFSYNLGLGYAPTPESITIEVNYNCMFRCKICQLWTKKYSSVRISNNRVLSKSEMENLIEEFSSLEVYSLYFCGGEPFLRDDFLDIVTYSKYKNMHCFTISNGYLISEDLARSIVLSGIDVIGISLDAANRELHDGIRGVKGAFDHAVKAIRLIKKMKEKYVTNTPEVFINCTVVSTNFMTLPELVDLSLSLGITRIDFHYLSVVDQNTVDQTNQEMRERVVGVHSFANIPDNLLLQKKEIDKLKFIITSIKKKSGTKVKCNFDSALLNGNKDSLLKGTFPVKRCNMTWRSAMITPIGDVVPCAMLTEYKMGNIREKSFREIWNNESAQKIRKVLHRKLPSICQKCCMIHKSIPSLWERTRNKLLRQ